MSSQINYGIDAFSLKDKEVFIKGNKNAGDKDSINLNYYLGCPHLMGGGLNNSHGAWYDYLKKKKPFFYLSKTDIKRLHNNHQQFFKALPFSSASLFIFIFYLSMAGLIGMGGSFIILEIIMAFASFDYSFGEIVLNPGCLWFLGITFVVSQISKFGMMNADDRFGFIFDRPSGKILQINKDQVMEHDFKDFVPLNDDNMLTGGGLSHDTYLYNTKNDLSFVIETTSVAKGVLAWNYLVQFMDVTQPLPDLPMHELSRHLDPVTKAYDEKTGRDPLYWANMGAKKARALHFSEYEKAKQWVEERRNLLHKAGTKNKKFLNKLVTQHLV